MPTQYFINVNYICNERCIFCAADIGNRTRRADHGRSLTQDQIVNWVTQLPPSNNDRVILAGGEPTLHRQLVPILQFLRIHFSQIHLFTNGLRFVDSTFARSVIEAGITRIEIALFGPTAQRHEAITRVPGSFDRTLEALAILTELRSRYTFKVEVRLLVSQYTSSENPDIVRLVRRRVPNIDAISLNRLILSSDALGADAPISWSEARASINESASLIREGGLELIFGSIPLCVFEGENASFVREQLIRMATSRPTRWQTRYLDATVSIQGSGLSSDHAKLALPEPCLLCDCLSECRRVEAWYVSRYGDAGLNSIRLCEP